MLQVEQDGVTTTQPTEPGSGLIAVAADRQLVGAKQDQRIEPARLQAHAALAMDRVFQCAACEHQAHGRPGAAAAPLPGRGAPFRHEWLCCHFHLGELRLFPFLGGGLAISEQTSDVGADGFVGPLERLLAGGPWVKQPGSAGTSTP